MQINTTYFPSTNTRSQRIKVQAIGFRAKFYSYAEMQARYIALTKSNPSQNIGTEYYTIMGIHVEAVKQYIKDFDFAQNQKYLCESTKKGFTFIESSTSFII